jgi:hypothetical protein
LQSFTIRQCLQVAQNVNCRHIPLQAKEEIGLYPAQNEHILFITLRITMKLTLRLYTVFIPIIFIILFTSCVSSYKQFYPGTYYLEDSIYENKTLQFLITYPRGWYLFVEPYEMDQKMRDFAVELHKKHLELLFAGATTDGLYGSRCIAANLNLPVKDFAESVRRANKHSIENDQGLIQFYAGLVPAQKWVFDQMGFRFVEYFIKINGCNIRFTFWTKPEQFNRYIDIFEVIMSTLTVTSPAL